MKKMKRLLLFLNIGMMALISLSCATMFSGAKQTVSFRSEPSGATVKVKGQEVCATPCQADIKRASEQHVTFSKDGYQAKEVVLSGSFNTKTLWSLLLVPPFGTLISYAIDYSTGAAWKYNSDIIVGKLTSPNGYVPQEQPQTQPQAQPAVRKKPASSGQELKVAVFNPTSKDVSEDIVSIVREEVSNAVVNASGYVVLEREQIDRVLAENKFQASGLVDDKQIGALGRQMGADKVCVTSIAKLGSAYHISCKLVDVTTAQIETQNTGKTVSGGGNIDEIVKQIVSTMLR
jgi:hypothetical protein